MKKLLLHLDTDPVPSVFDQVVAYDANVDNIMAYGSVTPSNVTSHIHGMMFTRGGSALKNSAIFIGGSDVSATELVGRAVKHTFFGSVRVSVMLDPNGSNTTAAAIVRKIMTRYDINGKRAVILGAGPVGQRAALYLLQEGAAQVVITSRSMARAVAITDQLKATYNAHVIPAEMRHDETVAQLLQDAHIAITSGPAGVCIVPRSAWANSHTLEVIADVNAVPPLGVEGIDIMDNGTEREQIRFYGAISVGNFKMKVHRSAIASLFEKNDYFLDEKTIYNIARKINE